MCVYIYIYIYIMRTQKAYIAGFLTHTHLLGNGHQKGVQKRKHEIKSTQKSMQKHRP